MTQENMESLIQQVIQVREKAYAPYSRFHVGAGVQVESGEWYFGHNVENASYGATICAERVAILKAVSESHRRITRIILVTDTSPASYPCGMCLQVMSEFMDGDAEIIIANLQGIEKSTNLNELFPKRFEL